MPLVRSELSHQISLERRDDILEMLASLNTAEISVDQQSACHARGYVCTLKRGFDDFDVQIFLDVASGDGSNIRFEFTEAPVPQYAVMQYEEQALDFLERLGFEMTNLEFSALSAEQRAKYFGQLSFFEQDQISPQSPGDHTQRIFVDAEVFLASGSAEHKVSAPKQPVVLLSEQRAQHLLRFLSGF